MTGYFDAHNHLQFYASEAELAAALAGAARAGVAGMICCATRPGDWAAVAAICASRPEVRPAFGVHPWYAGEAAGDWLAGLEALLRGPACVGEIGLDGVRKAPGQEEVFAAQLELARRLGRPAIIHCVRMWGRLVEMLKAGAPASFMLHAYSGPAELVPELAAMGAYFSFGGEVSDPRRAKLRAALAAVPGDRLLMETESPEPGGPSWRRGPAGIVETAAALAAARGIKAEAAAALCAANAGAFLKTIS